MSCFEPVLEYEAKKAATVSYVDEGRKRAFVQGARWLAMHFVNKTDHHPMCPDYMVKQLDEMSYKEIKKILKELVQYRECGE